MIYRFALVLLFVIVIACSSSEDAEGALGDETVVTPSSTVAVGATSTHPISPTSKPSGSAQSQSESNDAFDPDSLDPYLLTMLELTRFVGVALWPPIMLDGVDWVTAQQVMIEGQTEIKVAQVTVENISPPKTCSEFHSVWLDVMTELEARIALGVEVTGKMINDDTDGALQLSGAYDYQQELYGEMDRTWRACHESIDPEWERKIGIQQ